MHESYCAEQSYVIFSARNLNKKNLHKKVYHTLDKLVQVYAYMCKLYNHGQCSDSFVTHGTI